MDEGKPVDVVCLDFTKAFDSISHSNILEKMAAQGLAEYTLHYLRNICLEGWAQIVVVNGATSSW